MLKQYTINKKLGVYNEVRTTTELMEFIEHQLEKSQGVSITIQSKELVLLFLSIEYDILESVGFYWEIEGDELYIREF